MAVLITEFEGQQPATMTFNVNEEEGRRAHRIRAAAARQGDAPAERVQRAHRQARARQAVPDRQGGAEALLIAPYPIRIPGRAMLLAPVAVPSRSPRRSRCHSPRS